MAKKKNTGARIFPAHKPNEAVKWVYWYEGTMWDLIRVSSLEPGDIWRYEYPQPSKCLRERAAKCAKAWEEQLEG